jgi:hypothetical protein
MLQCMSHLCADFVAKVCGEDRKGGWVAQKQGFYFCRALDLERQL